MDDQQLVVRLVPCGASQYRLASAFAPKADAMTRSWFVASSLDGDESQSLFLHEVALTGLRTVNLPALLCSSVRIATRVDSVDTVASSTRTCWTREPTQPARGKSSAKRVDFILFRDKSRRCVVEDGCSRYVHVLPNLVLTEVHENLTWQFLCKNGI